MNLHRLASLAAVLAAPVCMAQLPPSALQPGRPVSPAPVNPLAPLAPQRGAAPAVPEVPAEIASAGAPNTLASDEVAQGWKLLFDGRRLLGMRGLQKTDPLSAGWKIEDGALWLPKDVKDMERMTGGDLITMDFFWDFDFRFDFKMTASANSGVRYMLSEAMGQVPMGLEYQIIDDVHNSIGLKGGKIRRTGALDCVFPVGDNARLRSADPLNKTGDPWNSGRILVQGNHVEHWLNGDKVLEFELGPQIRRNALAYRTKERPRDLAHETLPVTYGMKSKTRISILDQGYEVSFRNLKVLPMAPTAVLLPSAGGGVRPQGTSPVPNPLLLPKGTR